MFCVSTPFQQLRVVLRVTAVQVPRISMKRKRARPRTAQEGFPALFGGDEDLGPRLFGHIQGDGHVTKKGDAIVLGTASEDHGVEMALALIPCEYERPLAAPVAYVLSSRDSLTVAGI